MSRTGALALALALSTGGAAWAADGSSIGGDLTQLAAGGTVVGVLVALRGLRIRLAWTAWPPKLELEIGPGDKPPPV